MDTLALAGHAVELLGSYLPAAADVGLHVGEDAAAHALYETVARAFRRRRQSGALADFARNPSDSSLVKRLLVAALREDPQFAAQLAAAIAALPARATTDSVTQSGNIVGGSMAGRDIVQNTSVNTAGRFDVPGS